MSLLLWRSRHASAPPDPPVLRNNHWLNQLGKAAPRRKRSLAEWTALLEANWHRSTADIAANGIIEP